jgi:hypothetical protein
MQSGDIVCQQDNDLNQAIHIASDARDAAESEPCVCRFVIGVVQQALPKAPRINITVIDFLAKVTINAVKVSDWFVPNSKAVRGRRDCSNRHGAVLSVSNVGGIQVAFVDVNDAKGAPGKGCHQEQEPCRNGDKQQ